MTVRELLELIEQAKKLYPIVLDYNLAVVSQTIQEYDNYFTLWVEVRISHSNGIVIIAAAQPVANKE